MLLNCRQVADKEAAVFAVDKTHNLIVRLQYNVIRAGLRRINLAYSRISLADVASRLGEHQSTLALILHFLSDAVFRDRVHEVTCAASRLCSASRRLHRFCRRRVPVGEGCHHGVCVPFPGQA